MEQQGQLGTPLPKSAGQLKQKEESLQQISLRELKLRNKETEGAIKAVQARINFMRGKQEKTVKRVLNVKRKLTSLESVKVKAREQKELSMEERKKAEESQAQKAEFNRLIKDHLKYNKKIVMTLMNHKVEEESRSFKEKLNQLSMLNQIQRENMREENADKANRIRMDHIDAHEKRKLYFLDKLQQFKQFKEQKLKEELRERERQELIINEMEEKERVLLERLSVSEKFRLKCQQEYEEAKSKYHSFYEASKGLSRANSRENSPSEDEDPHERKAEIFIS